MINTTPLESVVGDYWYIKIGFDNNPPRLVKILQNSQFGLKLRFVGSKQNLSVYDVNRIDIAVWKGYIVKLIWLKQWKPNWFYRMIGY